MLKNTSKPMLAGAFDVEGITNIRDMLAAVVGGYEELKNNRLQYSTSVHPLP